MTITKVLISIDNSVDAENAAAYGFDIARKFNAAVGLVNIVEPVMISPIISGTDPVLGAPITGSGIEEMELLDVQKAQSEDIISIIAKKFAGEMTVTQFTDYGSVADGIVNCSVAFGADLIVIGNHDQNVIDRLLTGSVAEHVVRHAGVPVLVVPTRS